MTFAYHSQIKLGTVALYVSDLAKMTAFYTDLIGFEVLEHGEDFAHLGLAGQEEVLISLLATDLPREKSYGLFHTAILVPDRPALGASLKHLLQSGYPVTGASDHGYSEAIYLDDPEGNGIEIYRDRPEAEWDKREDGRIVGVTEPMDADGVLAAAQLSSPFKLVAGTRIGHVHLSVAQALETSKAYQNIFNFGDKFSMPSASWIASGDYHHHLAFNQWAGPGLSKKEDLRPGLAYLTIWVQDEIYFKAIQKKAALAHFSLVAEEEGAYLLEDSNGIRTWVRLEK